VRYFVLPLILILAAPLAAQPYGSCDEDVETLRVLYDLRRVMIRDGAPQYDIDRVIETNIDRLREPLPSGGHRWVRLVRPSGDGPVTKKERLIAASGTAIEEFDSEENDVFSVRIVVPRKRSVRRANNEVWIERVIVRYETNAGKKTIERSYKQWFPPDSSKTIDLPGIAERVEVVVETRARESAVRETLVETHFRLAVPQDDPASPFAQQVALLKRLNGNANQASVELEIARTEQRVFPQLPVFPVAGISSRIRQAELLLRSEKEEERERGRRLLSEAVRMLPY